MNCKELIFITEGVILAGGKGSRLNQNKLLMDYKGQPIIYHTVMNMLEICESVTIVTGFYNYNYLKIFNNDSRIKLKHNTKHLEGMFSSVLKGVEDIKNDCFIIPGDYPLVKGETYQKLLEYKGDIRVPIYKGRKGHPLFLKKHIVEKLKIEPITSNLKQFRDQFEVITIEVQDEGVLNDIDTIEDYNKLLTKRSEKVEDK